MPPLHLAGKWWAEDGVLHGTQEPAGIGGLLWHEGPFTDFVLKLQVQLSYPMDSGISLRVGADGRSHQMTLDYRPGSDVGAIFIPFIGHAYLYRNQEGAKLVRNDAWNDVTIRMEGEPARIRVWLNDRLLTDFSTRKRRPRRASIRRNRAAGSSGCPKPDGLETGWRGEVPRHPNQGAEMNEQRAFPEKHSCERERVDGIRFSLVKRLHGTFATIGLLALCSLSLTAQPLRFGQAAVNITPPAEMPFQVPQRPPFRVVAASGTHDPLQAKAVVFEAGGVKVAIVACDLTSIPVHFIAAAREHVAKISSVPPENVMITATHTHTGPNIRPRFFQNASAGQRKVATDYLARLPQLIAESVQRAEQNLTEARLHAAIGEVPGVAFNRRFLMKDGTVVSNPHKGQDELLVNVVRPAGPTDSALPVVYARARRGSRSRLSSISRCTSIRPAARITPRIFRIRFPRSSRM